MKHKPNQKRRVGTAFNSVDKTTGYAVRLERAKDGTWGGLPVAFAALGMGRTIKQAKTDVGKAIQLWLESTAEMGWPIPKPERDQSYAQR